MKANPVPPWRSMWRRVGLVALGALGALALAGALRGRATAPVPALVSTPVSTRVSTVEPMFTPPLHALLWSDDFDSPALPRAARAEADSRYGRYVTVGAPHLQFAAGSGIEGSGALRINWQASASRAGARCVDDSRLIEAEFAPAREIFVQFSVRYSPGFVFDWGRGGRCEGNAKKLFLLWARTGSRFVFISENGRLGVGSDEDHPLLQQNRAAAAVTPRALADGEWHRITFHVRQSSAPDRADGVVSGWIDGVAQWSYTQVVTHNAGGYHLFKFPATFNQGSPVEQTEWVDALKVWRPR